MDHNGALAFFDVSPRSAYGQHRYLSGATHGTTAGWSSDLLACAVAVTTDIGCGTGMLTRADNGDDVVYIPRQLMGPGLKVYFWAPEQKPVQLKLTNVAHIVPGGIDLSVLTVEKFEGFPATRPAIGGAGLNSLPADAKVQFAIVGWACPAGKRVGAMRMVAKTPFFDADTVKTKDCLRYADDLTGAGSCGSFLVPMNTEPAWLLPKLAGEVRFVHYTCGAAARVDGTADALTPVAIADRIHAPIRQLTQPFMVSGAKVAVVKAEKMAQVLSECGLTRTNDDAVHEAVFDWGAWNVSATERVAVSLRVAIDAEDTLEVVVTETKKGGGTWSMGLRYRTVAVFGGEDGSVAGPVHLVPYTESHPRAGVTNLTGDILTSPPVPTAVVAGTQSLLGLSLLLKNVATALRERVPSADVRDASKPAPAEEPAAAEEPAQ